MTVRQIEVYDDIAFIGGTWLRYCRKISVRMGRKTPRATLV